MNNDDTRPADTSGHTAQSEQSEAAATIIRNESDISMADLKAMHKETAERIKATSEQIKATSEQIKETGKQIRASGEAMGLKYCEVNEGWYRKGDSLDRDNLVKLFEARGFEVTASWYISEHRNLDGDGTTRQPEFNIAIMTDAEVVVFRIEVLLSPEDVKRFVVAMKSFARIFPEYASRKVYGGVAYIDDESNAGRYAAEQGLYVIRETGYSAILMNDTEFTPESFTKNTSAPVGGHLRLVPNC